MKKLLFILPMIILGLSSCGGTTVVKTSTAPKSTTSATKVGPSVIGKSSTSRPPSPWPAVAEGDGSELNPWNVTQAWDYVDKSLTITYETDIAQQELYQSKEEYYVRGYCCYIQTVSDGRDPNHPHSIKFYMADANHYLTAEEADSQDNTRPGFCVYFADKDPAFASEEESLSIQGKLVTVKGHLLNWGFVPEITSGGTIVNIVDK